jgi:hypothetical protein
MRDAQSHQMRYTVFTEEQEERVGSALRRHGHERERTA